MYSHKLFTVIASLMGFAPNMFAIGRVNLSKVCIERCVMALAYTHERLNDITFFARPKGQILIWFYLWRLICKSTIKQQNINSES
jgi:hypothetical protein